jgi:hypothetical protein
MRESLKKAQQKYMKKKLGEGWTHVRFFIPLDVKPELIKFKSKLMKGYYETQKIQ